MEIVKILMVSRYAGTSVSRQNEGNIARKLKKFFSPVRQQKQQY